MQSAPEYSDLWNRIASHAFDAAGATQTFESRLAAENGWTLSFTRQAIEEYRRFAFLYAVDGRPVSPPPIVDQVWHLHLIYSRNYWDAFCRNVLERPLHHEPATGIEGERSMLGDWYSSTFDRYKSYFGDPPADIWPTPAELSSTPTPAHQWVAIDDVVLLPRTAIYVVAAIVVILVLVMISALIENIGGDRVAPRDLPDRSVQ